MHSSSHALKTFKGAGVRKEALCTDVESSRLTLCSAAGTHRRTDTNNHWKHRNAVSRWRLHCSHNWSQQLCEQWSLHRDTAFRCFQWLFVSVRLWVPAAEHNVRRELSTSVHSASFLTPAPLNVFSAWLDECISRTLHNSQTQSCYTFIFDRTFHW
jgi:hypothetical protein